MRLLSSSSSVITTTRASLEYGEYPYVSGEEIKKALRVKAALGGMLDQMQ